MVVVSAEGISRLKVATAIFDLSPTKPASSDARIAKAYVKDATFGILGTTMTNSSLKPNGDGDVTLPLMVSFTRTILELSKFALSCSDDVDIRISYSEAVDQ